MLQQHIKIPMNTLILGCTHYPYMKDTIARVLKELYHLKYNNIYRYRACLAAHVELIDPAVETAKEAFVALRKQQLTNTAAKQQHRFFITIPNPQLEEVQLQPDGWFTYEYKYGRVAGTQKKYVKYVPFDHKNISDASYDRFKQVLPHAYSEIAKTF
jgi:glutamate racemase